jgi:hypothetical protein
MEPATLGKSAMASNNAYKENSKMTNDDAILN